MKYKYILLGIIIIFNIVACNLSEESIHTINLINTNTTIILEETANTITITNVSNRLIISISYSFNDYTNVLNCMIVPNETIVICSDVDALLQYIDVYIVINNIVYYE